MPTSSLLWSDEPKEVGYVSAIFYDDELTIAQEFFPWFIETRSDFNDVQTGTELKQRQ